jgi:hypothetical protein
MTLTSTGNLGIGTATPVRFNTGGSISARVLTVFNAGTDGANRGEIQIGNAGTASGTNTGLIIFGCGSSNTALSNAGAIGAVLNADSSASGNGAVTIYSTTAGVFTEKARIDSDGLKFNGDTAAANALDDYEEGTFTPTILFGGASAGVTYNTSFNGGHYTKIGNRVYVNGYLILSNKGSSTGAAAIGGLPFTSLNTTSPLSGFSAAALARINGITFADQLTGVNAPNSSTIEFYEATNAGVETTLTDADFINSSRIMFALTYQTTT